MKQQNPFIHQSSAALLACGFIASLLPGMAAAQDGSDPAAKKVGVRVRHS